MSGFVLLPPFTVSFLYCCPCLAACCSTRATKTSSDRREQVLSSAPVRECWPHCYAQAHTDIFQGLSVGDTSLVTSLPTFLFHSCSLVSYLATLSSGYYFSNLSQLAGEAIQVQRGSLPSLTLVPLLCSSPPLSGTQSLLKQKISSTRC